MFVPGDPVEQRKRALIAKLAGGRGRGQGGGGFKVGRPAGAGFGRGMGFGAAGGMGQRAVALPQMLGGYGGNPEWGQGGQDTSVIPQFDMSGDMMGPGDFGQHPVGQGFAQQQFQGPQSMVQSIPPQVLQQLLGGYGHAAPPPQPQVWGSGANRYY